MLRSEATKHQVSINGEFASGESRGFASFGSHALLLT
jgi:hypothetical protein